ncbi:MAG TPA: helix-turn-helix transcriptional regulator, partial [Candidatus Obscuribacterales bacterium]
MIDQKKSKLPGPAGIPTLAARLMTGGSKKKSAIKFSLRKLGLVIRQRRQELAFSQEDLAVRCRLHRTYISGIERGVRNPTITCIDD